MPERMRAEQALRDSERKLGALFELLPVGVAIVGADGEIAYTNPAHQRLIWGEPDALRGESPLRRQYLRPDGTPHPRDEFASLRAFQERQVVAGQETGIVGPASEVRWVSIISRTIAATACALVW